MSDATYRIDVEHRPGDPIGEWCANVTRISDDYPISVKIGASAEDVTRRAQEWCAEQYKQQQGFSVFVDDQGEPVEQHSVKA